MCVPPTTVKAAQAKAFAESGLTKDARLNLVKFPGLSFNPIGFLELPLFLVLAVVYRERFETRMLGPMFLFYLWKECVPMSVCLHRYFSHKGFKVGRVTQFVLYLGGCLASQVGQLIFLMAYFFPRFDFDAAARVDRALAPSDRSARAPRLDTISAIRRVPHPAPFALASEHPRDPIRHGHHSLAAPPRAGQTDTSRELFSHPSSSSSRRGCDDSRLVGYFPPAPTRPEPGSPCSPFASRVFAPPPPPLEPIPDHDGPTLDPSHPSLLDRVPPCGGRASIAAITRTATRPATRTPPSPSVNCTRGWDGRISPPARAPSVPVTTRSTRRIT